MMDLRNTKIGRSLEVPTSFLQCKYGVAITFESVNRGQLSLVSQNLSWPEQIGHKFDRQGVRRQRAGNLRNAVRRICVEIECKWFCKPINGQSKTTRTQFCQVHPQELFLLEKVGLIFSQEHNRISLTKFQKTDCSSSSWSFISRSWCDWIFGEHRNIFGTISTLIWSKVEEYNGKKLSKSLWRRSKIILIEKPLQADLQQKNVYYPFSNDSKAMICEVGNVELF